MHLALISTSGNQSYIFASNRLREAVGASRLVTVSTTDWVRDGLGDGTVLQATSGSTLVTVPDEPAARALARRVTLKALREAPGLAVRVVHAPIDGDTPTGDEVGHMFRTHAEHVASRPSVAARHQRVPAAAACDSTDWPAARWHTDDPHGLRRRDEKEPPALLCEEVIAKRRERPAAQRVFAALLAGEPDLAGRRLIEVEDLFEAVEWVGVVHADGNRLGVFFRAATDLLGGERLGALSEQVQEVSDAAFRAAVLELSRRVLTGRLPIVPLIVGGDDLTALVDGRHVLAFTEAYLTAFAEHSSGKDLVSEVLTATGAEVLTASAGVAIVKPHFPFSVAYALAEQLCGNAKAALTPGLHGIDVHVLIDSIAADLPALRERYDAASRLTERPFLLGAGSATPPPGRDWGELCERLHRHRWGRPALALDLMEEFRPITVDVAVWRCVSTRAVRPEQFQTEPGTGCRMSPDAKHRFLDAYEKRLLTLTTHRTSGRRVSFRVALGLQAKLLARRLLDRGEVYLPLRWK